MKRKFEQEVARVFGSCTHFSGSSGSSGHVNKDSDTVSWSEEVVLWNIMFHRNHKFSKLEKNSRNNYSICYSNYVRLQSDKSYSETVGLFLHLLTGHSTLWISLLQGGGGGEPHVPPYHHPPCLHAAQLHMLLSHSPTAMSSENHAPLAYHRKEGNTWGRKEDMDTHTHTVAKSKEVRQWTETIKEWRTEDGGK